MSNTIDPELLTLPAGTMATEGLPALLPRLGGLYRDLHAHPELSMQETRTAALVAAMLRAQGWEVTAGVGGTGVVGVLRNGPGPVVLLRADMDGLPIREETGLPYASRATAKGPDGTPVPVMHGCGHDHHVTALLGATALLAADRTCWSGTLLAVFQPGEETGQGARAMLADGFLDRFPHPDVCLSQHVVPGPVGTAAIRSGVALSACDNFRIRLFGTGGHGSRPELTVDPIVMGAHLVTRLQTIVSRETAPQDSAVVTVGSFHAGRKENIIPDQAELDVNVRAFDAQVRRRVLDSIRRIVHAEAQAAGAPREPEIIPLSSFPLTVNDEAAAQRVVKALKRAYGPEGALAAGSPLAASEDFSLFGAAAGCPSAYWTWGGTDPTVTSPSTGNHSPHFAPLAEPVIEYGVRSLLAVTQEFAGPAVQERPASRRPSPAAASPTPTPRPGRRRS